MTRTHKTEIGKWQITFKNNVHMYCHALTAERNGTKIEIPCEDLPETDKTMGIWLDDIKTKEETKRELIEVMLSLSKEMNYRCRVYLGGESHEN